jgi:hypothetical protein
MNFLLPLILLITPLAAGANSSQEARASKTYEATIQAGGDYRMSPTSLALMYFFNADNLLGLKAGVDRTGVEHQTNIALQFKHYASNSFYVAPEIFYLNTNEDVIGGFWSDVFNIQREYARYSSMGAGIRIGNQWTWKYVTVGCDWVGIGHRFGTWRRETRNLHSTTYTIMNFIVGVSW